MVARVVKQAEIDRTPEAKAAMDTEWQELVDKSCCLHEKVREFRDVSAEAFKNGIKTSSNSGGWVSRLDCSRLSSGRNANAHALISVRD